MTKTAPRVLVVLMASTRGWELSIDSFTKHVLDELDADLALCVNDRDDPGPLYDRARYAWYYPELDDWGEAFDRSAGHSRWRVLLSAGDHVFGGVVDHENPQTTRNAAVLYSRVALSDSITAEGILDAYDWLVMTRSDFVWPIPHPDVRHLSPRHIYLLDGEEYGGFEDRHAIVPRRHLPRFLAVPEPIFTEPEALRRSLDRRMAMQGWAFMNNERFLAARLKRLGLARRVRHLPYFPYLARGRDTPTNWSVGEYHEELGHYVKYPGEYERSLIGRRFVSDQASWSRYLAPIRGRWKRRELQREYHAAGLYERPFSYRHVPVRAYRDARYAIRRQSDRWHRDVVPRIGRRLRRLPGMASVLDARLDRIRRRAVRRGLN